MPIFDQGYQHFHGSRSSHGWRWLTIARHGVRAQLRGKLLRLLLIVAYFPSLTLIGALIVWGLFEQQNPSVLVLVRALMPADVVSDPGRFRLVFWTICYSQFFQIEMFLCMVMILLVGPNLISRDLRYNAFPLYFSRPLTRFDYFAGQLSVIGFFVCAVLVAPAFVAYVAGLCFSPDWQAITATYPLLFASVAIGFMVTFFAGSVMLALSSLSRRSLYVGLAWVGVWLLTSTLATGLTAIHREMLIREAVTAAKEELNERFPNRDKSADDQPSKWKQFDADQDQVLQAMQRKAKLKMTEDLAMDWRPAVSFSANLSRLADWMLDTDSAWLAIGQAATKSAKLGSERSGFNTRGPRMTPFSDPTNERRLADAFVLQFPWYWSAGVLTFLSVVSIWILTFRVKSLDRLK